MPEDSSNGTYPETPIPGLFRLSVGDGDASFRALLGNGQPERSFATALERFDLDLVVLAASAEAVLPDGNPIARLADGVLITVMLGRTTRAELRDALSLLRSAGAHVLGTATVG
ncbi:MAG: hypothetical protein M3198_14250 [Actinomycetota bacterium]|nr:hypothetical protein [Actinomycetota bacterium]